MIKKALKHIVGIGATIVVLVVGVAATFIGVNPTASVATIDSTSTTNTVLNFPAWPNWIPGGTLVTNFVPISIPQTAKEVSLQFSCQSTNTTTTSNVVWSIYRSTRGQTPTNAIGIAAGGLLLDYDLLGYVTNFLNGVTRVSTVATYTTLARTTAATGQSTDPGIAGVTTLYVAVVNVPTLSGLTNYQAYVNVK